MTGRERLISALKREKPDRLPTLEWVLDTEITQAITGDSDQIEFAKKRNIDGVSVSLNYRNTTIDDKHFVDEWGVTRISYDEYPTPVKHPIETLEDFEKLKIPDPNDEYHYQSIRDAVTRCKTEDIAVVGRVKDIFSQPRDLMGFQEFLMSFYLEPELATRMMEMCVEHSTVVGKNLRKLGVDIVVIGDDIAHNTGLLLSPEMFREQVLPHLTELVQNLKKEGLYVIKHSDGDLNSIVDDLVGTGIDCLDPIDPLGHMDMKSVTEQYANQIARKGNVDCVSVLVDQSVEKVWAETARCILEGAQPGGHIISSSNSIHRGINPTNYSAFLDAARELGVYPLDIERLNKVMSGGQ